MTGRCILMGLPKAVTVQEIIMVSPYISGAWNSQLACGSWRINWSTANGHERYERFCFFSIFLLMSTAASLV